MTVVGFFRSCGRPREDYHRAMLAVLAGSFCGHAVGATSVRLCLLKVLVRVYFHVLAQIPRKAVEY